MLDSLQYSLNATVPVFLVIVIGYGLKQIGWLKEEFVNGANKINFKITLPALLFQDIAGTAFTEVFDIKYVLYCAIVTSICFWGIWGLSKIFMKSDEMRGAFVQASFRGSAAVLGSALMLNMYGNIGMIPLMIIGAVPLYNIYSVIVLTFESNDGSSRTIGSAVKGIITNPIILAIVAGMAVSLSGITFPVIIDSTISSLARMATPLALIAIGAGFEGKKALQKRKPAMIAAVIKLVVQPLVFLPVALALGFTDEKLVALIIMLGAPTTPSCYIMAKNMGNDGVLTSSIVVLTTILSAFSITGILFVLRSIGAI